MTRGAQTRQQILESALRLASSVGVQGLTIGSLAKTVGMSKSGLFAHFQSIDNLQLRVLEKATENFIDVVLRPAFKELRGEPRVQAIMNHWIAWLNEKSKKGRPPGSELLITASLELDDQPGKLKNYLKEVQGQLLGNLEKAARLAIKEGHFRTDLDVKEFAWAMYSFVMGYYHFHRMMEDPRAKSYLDRGFEILLRLARAKTGTRRPYGIHSKHT